MNGSLREIIRLVNEGQARISMHGYDELAADSIFVRDVISGIETAVLIEDYPDFYKGPTILVRQLDAEGNPIHIVWGIPAGAKSPAVLVTAYRPDPNRWSTDFLRRKS